MNYSVFRTERAFQDIDEIVEFLEQDSPDVADRFLRELERAFTIIAEMPHKGNPMGVYDKRLKGLRRWPVQGFEKYLIFYLTHEKTIEVLRVFHSSQNYLKSLKNELL